jgi:hypothetical protein
MSLYKKDDTVEGVCNIYILCYVGLNPDRTGKFSIIRHTNLTPFRRSDGKRKEK